MKTQTFNDLIEQINQAAGDGNDRICRESANIR